MVSICQFFSKNMKTNVDKCQLLCYYLYSGWQMPTEETEVRIIKARGAIKFYDLYLRIFEKGYSIESFAEKMGFSSRTLYSKLQGKTDWKWSEMIKAAQYLGCTKQISKYFF